MVEFKFCVAAEDVQLLSWASFRSLHSLPESTPVALSPVPGGQSKQFFFKFFFLPLLLALSCNSNFSNLLPTLAAPGPD
jgi:hypothetical protein